MSTYELVKTIIGLLGFTGYFHDVLITILIGKNIIAIYAIMVLITHRPIYIKGTVYIHLSTSTLYFIGCAVYTGWYISRD